MTEGKQKLSGDIKRFFDVYKILTPDGKAAFEAQMGPLLSKADQNTRALYQSLLASAKDDIAPADAIERLKTTSVQNGKTNKPGKDQDKPGSAAN